MYPKVGMLRRAWLILCFLFALVAAQSPTSKFLFRDVAAAAGLTVKNLFGGLERKDYILETTGNGVAIFDYDGDGHNDIFITNGTRLNSTAPSPSQLYHN